MSTKKVGTRALLRLQFCKGSQDKLAKAAKVRLILS